MTMEIEVVEKRENKLLNRTEVRFKIIHTGQRTTERELVRSDLAEMFKVNKDRVIVDHIKSGFGIQESMSYAKIYKTVDDATKVEPKYILKRNRVVIGKEKEVKEGAKEAASEEKKVVEKSQPEIKPGEKQGNEDKLDEGEKPETQRVEGTRDSTKQKQKTEDSGGSEGW
ncbi:MAG TPA: hypothetical protein EYP23_03895 [Thermoplasmata archaeon]|nr:hypothetical protein [Thermoplasmata archaeon]